MDGASAAKVFAAESVESGKPALVRGARRLFNRDVPLKADENSLERGMLNIEVTGEAKDLVNGIVYTISVSELEKLALREVGYDLVPLIGMDWEEACQPKAPRSYRVYALSASGPSYISSNILPRPDYYQFCLDAARRRGFLFHYLFCRTTFHANGQPLSYCN